MEKTTLEILNECIDFKTGDIDREKAVRLIDEQNEKYKWRARKWNDLAEKIARCYDDDDSNSPLCQIGEIAAIELGYI